MGEQLLPSSWVAPITTTVGVFRLKARDLAEWLAPEFRMQIQPVSVGSIEEEILELLPLARVDISRVFIFECAGWSFLLNNWTLGTDLGMIPSICAREKSAEALRLTIAEDSPNSYGATIMELFDPQASDEFHCKRVICAANDGGKWVFSQFGAPLPFEDVKPYSFRRVRDRFTPQMLRHYTKMLGVPEVGSKTIPEKSFFLRKSSDDA